MIDSEMLLGWNLLCCLLTCLRYRFLSFHLRVFQFSLFLFSMLPFQLKTIVSGVHYILRAVLNGPVMSEPSQCLGMAID